MKKQYIIYTIALVATLFFSKGHAQENDTRDSLQRKVRYFSVDNPMWLKESVEARQTLLQLGYGTQAGDYRAAQDAQKARNINFNSEGSVTVKDVRLWGRFAYSNTIEDSTRFGHKTRHNPSSPWYFGSYGYNHYERTNYNIQARGQRYFAKDRFSVFGGLDYQIGNHFSNNDPRGNIDEIQVNGRLGLSAKLGNTVELGVEGHYGYGQENVEIAFRDDQRALVAVESPYLNYIVRGYGWKLEDWLLEKDMNYQNDMKRYGGALYLSWQSDLGKFYGKAQYGEEEQAYSQVLRNQSRNNALDDYRLKKLNYELLWDLRRDNKRYMAHLKSANNRGKDKVIESGNAANYAYQYDAHSLNLSYQVLQQRWQQLYEARVGLTNEVRRDGGISATFDYSRLDLSLSSLFTYQLSAEQHIELGLSALYSQNTAMHWSLPAINENIFHQYVFYHDIIYNQADTWGGRVHLGYRQPLNNKNFLRLTADGGYTKAVNLPELSRTTLSRPETERYDMRVTLAFGF
ncbi:DUF6850 family outer membrane beta-barrel protein [Sphingobacterium bambusae]|uniref:DUF6850 family outer membrane beta-barrel protein n=1 Tax=Sphingobacterium bambusae TaxID=662858 RepID=A0ABW6BNV5_9SPHI|nr:DUF6850 family outer membrane beta-barrel protein [Sphingobacterium bambusae]WPL48104.1 hypothetical protein SCB77_19310 [Sphingobacterium bambusae]